MRTYARRYVAALVAVEITGCDDALEPSPTGTDLLAGQEPSHSVSGVQPQCSVGRPGNEVRLPVPVEVAVAEDQVEGIPAGTDSGRGADLVSTQAGQQQQRR